MKNKENRTSGSRDGAERDLADSGGKRSWGRTVASVPTDRDDDPKPHERNKGDFSNREGDRGGSPRDDFGDR